jgi:predicted AlkP superfamily pyrophosphatase or phosphodiesterase
MASTVASTRGELGISRGGYLAAFVRLKVFQCELFLTLRGRQWLLDFGNVQPISHQCFSDDAEEDHVQVDHNVTRHVANEMEQDDWNAMILHCLGVDHIGHMSGPESPHMIDKQIQMDLVVKTIFEAIDTRVQHHDTLLFLLGDHGTSYKELSRRVSLSSALQADKSKV